MFSKGTLGTLLSYRALLNSRVVDKVLNQEFRTPARAVGTRCNALPSSVANEVELSRPKRSLEFEFENESHSVTLRFFLEVGKQPPGCTIANIIIKNGTPSKELYAPPIAGRIVLNRLKLELGLRGVEAVDIFEVFHKGKLAWTRVHWTSPILAQPGDMLFFRKVGVTHMVGWEIDSLYL